LFQLLVLFCASMKRVHNPTKGEGVTVVKGVGVSVAKRVELSEAKGVDLSVAKGVGVSVAKGVGVPVAEGVGVSVANGVGVSVAIGVGLSVAKGVGVSVAKGMELSVTKGVGLSVAIAHSSIPVNTKEETGTHSSLATCSTAGASAGACLGLLSCLAKQHGHAIIPPNPLPNIPHALSAKQAPHTGGKGSHKSQGHLRSQNARQPAAARQLSHMHRQRAQQPSDARQQPSDARQLSHMHLQSVQQPSDARQQPSDARQQPSDARQQPSDTQQLANSQQLGHAHAHAQQRQPGLLCSSSFGQPRAPVLWLWPASAREESGRYTAKVGVFAKSAVAKSVLLPRKVVAPESCCPSECCKDCFVAPESVVADECCCPRVLLP